MKPILTVIILALFYSCSHKSADFNPKDLQCEHLVNPIGIDSQFPRFSWQLSGDGFLQSACQIIVSTDEGLDKQNVIWDSGIIDSTTIPVVYNGAKLEPFTRYYWKVRVKDENGSWSGYSKPAYFETGMMGLNNWQGSWITDVSDYHLKPAPYFRKEFKLAKQVKSARAYIAVGGLYELSINGKKVGNHRLDPMYTRFDRRTMYVTYDVTDQLSEKENAIGVILGNGWFNHQSTAVWYFDKAPWRSRPKFCMDLRLTYDDGTTEVISTGDNWKTSPSPIILNSIYTAEHYDARQEIEGWNETGFDDSKWGKVLLTAAPSNNIVAQSMVPIRNVEEISAKSVNKFNDKTYVFDFGRNISGVSKIKVEGKEGTTIKLIHGERLKENGHVDQSNIDVHYRPTDDSDPFQTDILILSGKKEDVFMPKFNYKGFQYVEVSSDKPITLTKENLTAYFMHSDVEPVGSISSSNEILNKTWWAANNSYLSNLFGYPTDCPQREKNGWTGDAHINIETGLYNYDAITVYEKWMADHRDEQQPNGVLPAIIPTGGWGYTWANGPDWTSTIAIIPWNVYLFYGDQKILEDNYDNIKLYVDYIDTHWPSGITDWGLGDWVPVKSKTPKEFTSTAYYYADAVILSKAAKILGKDADYEKYQALAQKIKDAVNEKYLNKEIGIYGSGYQTELSAALFWGLVPDELTEKVASNLAERVEQDNKHIDVGLLGTKTILNALSENGYADLAYEVAAQEDFPSWGWWIKNGATTFYENWPLDASRDLSLNHIMFGEINAWYYKGLGGIFPDEENPGFKNVILKPNFVKGLDHFEAKHKSPYGQIISSWKRTSEGFNYLVSIPSNSTAMFQINAKQILEGNEELAKNKSIIVEKLADSSSYQLRLIPGNYQFQIVK